MLTTKQERRSLIIKEYHRHQAEELRLQELVAARKQVYHLQNQLEERRHYIKRLEKFMENAIKNGVVSVKLSC